MTQERLMQIVRNGENVDYEFGKESAADLIQKKEVSTIRDEPCMELNDVIAAALRSAGAEVLAEKVEAKGIGDGND